MAIKMQYDDDANRAFAVECDVCGEYAPMSPYPIAAFESAHEHGFRMVSYAGTTETVDACPECLERTIEYYHPTWGERAVATYGGNDRDDAEA